MIVRSRMTAPEFSGRGLITVPFSTLPYAHTMFIYVAVRLVSWPVSFSLVMKGLMKPTEKLAVFVSKLNSASMVLTSVMF